MYLHKSETDKALPCFEKAASLYPDNFETLKVLSALYAADPSKERRDKALHMAQRACELQPKDADAQVRHSFPLL
jgi:tetratricopeptide (TPR) repeat protein